MALSQYVESTYSHPSKLVKKRPFLRIWDQGLCCFLHLIFYVKDSSLSFSFWPSRSDRLLFTLTVHSLDMSTVHLCSSITREAGWSFHTLCVCLCCMYLCDVVHSDTVRLFWSPVHGRDLSSTRGRQSVSRSPVSSCLSSSLYGLHFKPLTYSMHPS